VPHERPAGARTIVGDDLLAEFIAHARGEYAADVVD
jgi:hypothetical protein